MSYSFQTFSVGQVLQASHMNQVEVNIRDHVHGSASVSGDVPNTAATQADQEAGSSVVTIVTPGRQKFHPSAAKAWAIFNGTTAGTNAPILGFNVTSITRNATGDYTVNLTTGFSNTSYVGFVMSGVTSGGSNPIVQFISSTASTWTFNIVKRSDGSADDASSVFVVFFGDQ